MAYGVFRTGGDFGERFTAIKSDALTNAVYKVKEKEKYVRVECVDAEGRTAWSNPTFSNSKAKNNYFPINHNLN